MKKEVKDKPSWLFVDLDGTLIDSIPAIKKVFFEIGNYSGVKLSEKDFSVCDGMSLKEISSYIAKKGNCSQSEIFSKYEKALSNLYRKTKLRKNARSVLINLKKNGWRLAIVTSAKKEYAENSLKFHNVNKLFEFVISGESAPRAKPYPDLFQVAQKKAGDGYFFALDDSVNGVEAARRANCFIIRFNSFLTETHFFSVKSFNELNNRICLAGGDYPFIFSSADKFSFVLGRDNLILLEEKDIKKVDDFWKSEKKSNPKLFDGQTFAVTEELKPFVFSVCMIPYRYIHYQRQTGNFLGFIALGVTGVVRKKNKVFLAKRPEWVTAYRNYFEYVPAGSISQESLDKKKKTISVVKELRKECKEELNFSPKSLSPNFLAIDGNDYVMDVVYEIKLPDGVNPKLGEEHITGDFFSRSYLKDLYHRGEKFIPLVLLCEKIS